MTRPAESPLWLDVDGLRWHARTWRSGKPPLVMPHGFVISSRYLVPLARVLAEHFDVYAPDLPGFGRSHAPSWAPTVPRLAEALGAWMEAAGVPRAPLLGNSLGGQLIVELAAAQPRRVERAVLVGPTGNPDMTAAGYVARIAVAIPLEPPMLWLSHLPDQVHAGPVRAFQLFRAMVEHDALARSPAVSCPTLIVRGRLDPICTRGYAERLRAAIPDGRVAEVPGGHVPNWTRPHALARAALPFLLGQG